MYALEVTLGHLFTKNSLFIKKNSLKSEQNLV